MPPKKTKQPNSTSTTVDPKDARAAYEQLRERMDALRSDELLIPRVDVQRAAVHAFGIAERDRAPERAAEFLKLVKAGTLEPAPSDRLARCALAAWHTRQQQQRHAAKGGGVVPAPTAEAADAIKRRMLRVVTHAFGDDPRFALDIAAIREGQGYQDLANDLQQLADLYEDEEIAAVVKKDPVHYRATDVADARSRASDIFRALGYESSEAAQWTARTHRAYTLLDEVYREHSHAGAYLFFRREDVEVTYPPSLVTAVRAPRGRPDVQEPELPADPDEPAEPDPQS